MLVFALTFAVIGGAGLFLTIRHGEYVKSLLALGYLFAAIPIVAVNFRHHASWHLTLHSSKCHFAARLTPSAKHPSHQQFPHTKPPRHHAPRWRAAAIGQLQVLVKVALCRWQQAAVEVAAQVAGLLAAPAGG